MDNTRLKEVKDYLIKNKTLSNYFHNYSRMYMMTTENINGFLNQFNVENKSILTVAGSGDQRLNSYSLGAKDVTCFDINPLTELHLKLKDTAIRNIDLEKFISFFEIKDNYNREYSSLDPRIFKEFKDYLDEDVYSFYNYVINESIYLRSRDIYIDFINDLSNQKKINNYLDLDSYTNLRSIIKDKPIIFIESNVFDLPDKLNGKKYDMILLSNISDYIHLYTDNHMSKYKELVDRLKDNLNNNGIIEVGYIYSYYNRGEDISDFHYDDIRNKYFPFGDYLTRFVDSYYNDGSYDKVLIYKK